MSNISLAQQRDDRGLDTLDLQKADPGDMLGRIRELPAQCRNAWQQVSAFQLPADYHDVDAVAILGMGGSAIGGDLARTLAAASSPVPIVTLREYDLPSWVNRHTLVIGSSYSGNTEETLSAFAQAVERRCKLIAITTGGKLREIALAAQSPVFQFDYKSQPRAALGYSVTPLIGIFQKLGLMDDQAAAMMEAVQVMGAWQQEIDATVPTERNAAKQLAGRLHGKIPIVYGSGLLAEVARRWKGQVNENAKNWGVFEVLPELDHNAVLGYDHPADLAGRLAVIMLTSITDHPRVALRQKVTAELLQKAGVAVEWVSARGQRPLAQMLSIIHFGDYVSYYLALLNSADPSHVNAINYLKGVLAAA